MKGQQTLTALTVCVETERQTFFARRFGVEWRVTELADMHCSWRGTIPRSPGL